MVAESHKEEHCKKCGSRRGRTINFKTGRAHVFYPVTCQTKNECTLELLQGYTFVEERKRYLAFVFNQHYPRGGLDDLLGSFDTVHEAVAAIEASEHIYREEGQVVDGWRREILARFYRNDEGFKWEQP